MRDMEHKQALPLGYELRGYRLRKVLGVGGFGVTYLAAHATLGHSVAIKEYLPNEFAVREGTTVYPKSEADREDFDWGLARFLDEAKTLARFEHRNLVRVRDYFEANSTAYIVMDYEEGESLDLLLERHGRLSEGQLRRVLLPIIEGLREVHEAGYLHRDIKPSNVYVRRSDESPVLLDFGSARQALGQKSKSLTAVASAGYSPPEQYESEGEQGPWTDIYALSALCYRAITGKSPIEAPRRMNRLAQRQPDPLPKLVDSPSDGFSESFLDAVDQGLEVIVAERPRNLDEWVARLAGASTVRRDSSKGTLPSPSGKKQVGAATGGLRRAFLIGGGAAVVLAAAVIVWKVWIEEWVTEPRNEQEPLASEASGASSPAEVRQEGRPTQPLLNESPARGDAVQASSDAPPTPGGEEESSPLGGSAILVIETDPPGAEVLLSDGVVGTTPFERSDLRAGTYTVTLRHRNYQTVRLEDQTIGDGEVLRIRETLIPGVGKLTVLTEPRDVWIEWDGERVARGTPVTLEELPAGMVELTLGANEHRSIQVQVQVPNDGVGRLERTLERIPYGTLTLELVPANADVTLPDVAPAYRPGIRLPEGQHRMVVSRTGYLEVNRTIAISGDTRDRIELKAIPMRTGDTFQDKLSSGDFGPEIVVIPAGSFRMGCVSGQDCEDDEKPVHEVVIPGIFALAKFEVTVRQFRRFVQNTGYETDAERNSGGVNGCRTREIMSRNKWDWTPGRSWRNLEYELEDEFPVSCVSWNDASAYVKWLSEQTGERYRLPSEAEWEYSVRAGSETKYYFGDTAEQLCRYGNVADDTKLPNGNVWTNRANCSDGAVYPTKVGSYRPNAFGLYDMHGNVWEWVEDCWNDSYAGASADGSSWLAGDCSRRVLRGGSWFDDPGNLRSADRIRNTSGNRNSFIGFRVARTLTP